ncbi:MAG: hypothetical protein K9N11_03100 [Lentisphaeria bacterium]|nr:hypothetical protein [Candidatus Neomarinimicrobiota bacterium]MCF7841820.1 hypothetical protein [Lentisphaeria bacterium]
MNNAGLDSTIHHLEGWLQSNGLYGYDPYDIKGHSSLIRFQKNPLTRKSINLFVEAMPLVSRKIFQIKPVVNAKAVALLTLAYLNRYKYTQNQNYLKQAKLAGKWLVKHANDWDPNIVGWGYPFDWQSRVMIPRGTPSSVVTAFGLQAVIALQNKFSDLIPNPRKFFLEAGQFFTELLNQSPEGCFSYTPVDQFKVHNANLFSAYSLLLLADLTENAEYSNLAKRAVDYTISQQGPEGGFGYWGDEFENKIIDNFHTGYVIRLLYRINGILNHRPLEDTIDRAMHFYSENLFEGNFPKDRHNRLYPIDVHTLTEVILVYCELPAYRKLLKSKVDKTLSFIINKMQYKPGYIAYKKYPLFTVKFPFLRWNQAWTYYALSELQRCTE